MNMIPLLFGYSFAFGSMITAISICIGIFFRNINYKLFDPIRKMFQGFHMYLTSIIIFFYFYSGFRFAYEITILNLAIQILSQNDIANIVYKKRKLLFKTCWFKLFHLAIALYLMMNSFFQMIGNNKNRISNQDFHSLMTYSIFMNMLNFLPYLKKLYPNIWIPRTHILKSMQFMTGFHLESYGIMTILFFISSLI